jgi:hypothetical protein
MIFPLDSVSRPAVKSTQPPTQWLPGAAWNTIIIIIIIITTTTTTLSSTVLLEKLVVAQLVKKLLAFNGTRMLLIACRYPDPTLISILILSSYLCAGLPKSKAAYSVTKHTTLSNANLLWTYGVMRWWRTAEIRSTHRKTYPENRGDKSLRNTGNHVQDYTLSQPTRQSEQWEKLISLITQVLCLTVVECR